MKKGHGTQFGRAPGNLAKRSYNPAFMHPDDLARLGLRSGDLVTIRSRNGAITGVVEEDEDLRTGLVSLTHGLVYVLGSVIVMLSSRVS